jgi:predicted small metal-binding protein
MTMAGVREYKQFTCRDAGVECEFMVQAEAEEEVIKYGYDHLCRVHDQCRVSPFIEEKVKLSIKDVWVGSGRFLQG